MIKYVELSLNMLCGR